MILRKGAPLLFALVALLGAADAASASHCGFFRFSRCKDACSDAQNCYSSCQQQNRVCYKLVYDTVEEKRWHTCYKTVCETVNKQVTRYREECQTRYRECQVTKHKDVMEESTRQVRRTCWKDVQCTHLKPRVETCYKDVECVVRRCVPKCIEKECHYTVCVPKVEQHCHTQRCQVQKQICEQICREVCQKVCRPVTQTCYRDVCCQVAKCVEECHMRQVCVPCVKDVVRTCHKNVTRRICEPCTTMKTVTRRVIECVDEPCNPCRDGLGGWLGNGPIRNLLNRLGQGVACGDGACGNACPKTGDACRPAVGSRICRTDCCDPCFDPCACKTFHLADRIRSRLAANACADNCKGDACGNACGRGPILGRNACGSCAPVPTTRKVWRVKCITEQVPVTRMVTRFVTESVPFTVCEKVRYTEVRNVPTTVRRIARGAYVDDKGVGHDTDAPGRKFTEKAVARKQVPYNVTRMVSTMERKTVVHNVPRVVRGAYVDDKGKGHGADAPGRAFKEGAHFDVSRVTTTTRMVQEQRVKKVQHIVNVMVEDRRINRVPYQVCKMVPHTVTKKVPYTVCETEKVMVPRRICYTECVKVPYTVRCMVPYTETVPCQVTKQVKVCVPVTVQIKKARLVPVTVSREPGPGAPSGPNAPCGPGAPCAQGPCGKACPGDACCNRLGNRLFGRACPNDFCREGLLQRVFRNRFCCDPCSSPCSTTSGGTTQPMPPADPKTLPKALPKN